jgi:predicted phage terminase large subunit-like protein
VIPRGGVNELFILDAYRNRVRDMEQLVAIVNMYSRFRENAFRIGIEHGQIWLAIEIRLKQLFRKKGLSPVFDEELKPIQDKQVRATPLQGWMQNHRVWFPKNQPWVQKAKDEMLRFDAGVHDDFVDCFAWMVRMAQKMPLVEKFNAREAWGNEKSVNEMLEDYARDQESSSGTGYMSA